MALYTTEQTGILPDGSDLDVDYAITDDAGDPLTGIVSVQYKLTDNTSNELIPWTSLATTSTGSINVPGSYNRIVSCLSSRRELAMYVVYSGTKVATDKFVYTLNDILGVTVTSP